MDAIIDYKKAQFLTELESRDIDDDDFFLLSPLRYYSPILGGIIEVEKGFVSDGSSVPRVPLIYWFYGNRAHREAVVHDRIYRAKDHAVWIERLDGKKDLVTLQKSVADSVFLEAMTARGKPKWIRNPMYWGTELGGLSSWLSGPSRLEFKII